LCPNLRICGHLPAPIINGGGDSLWRWPNFWHAGDLNLGSGHTAYCHASLIDLYLNTKFHWNRVNFLWTAGRTFETHFIRSTHSRPKNELKNQLISIPQLSHLSQTKSHLAYLPTSDIITGHSRWWNSPSLGI